MAAYSKVSILKWLLAVTQGLAVLTVRTPALDAGFPSVTVTKSRGLAQWSDAAPELNEGTPFTVLMGAISVSGNVPTEASVVLPTTVEVFLGQVAGIPGLGSQNGFPDLSEADQAFPPGAYRFRYVDPAWFAVLAQYGVNKAELFITLPVPENQFPPVVKLADFPAAQKINPRADYTLRWEGGTLLTNQGSAALQIVDPTLPPGANLVLMLNTNTPGHASEEMVIPKGTLSAGRTYVGVFTRTEIAAFEITSQNLGPGLDLPLLIGSVSFVTQLAFPLSAIEVPELKNARKTPEGMLSFDFSSTIGKGYTVEQSTDFSEWVKVGDTNATTELTMFSAGISPADKVRAFRVKTN